MTTEDSYLSLQGSIICLLLALVGSAAIIEHPEWFGSVPQASVSVWRLGTPAE